tara:strand:+ start:894 stop:1067 length:174 start_codon:yes stop_codon:yes gene_type:complete
MEIKNAKYIKFNENENIAIQVTIDGVDCSVPINKGNRHYQAIIQWVEEGNTIEEAND